MLSEPGAAGGAPSGGRRRKALQVAGAVALIAAAATAGLFAGRAVRDWRASKAVRGPRLTAPAELALKPGTAVPEVALVGEGGEPATARALLAAGGVLIFLSPTCPACTQALDRWQERLDGATFAGLPVVGVVTNPPDQIAPYRAEKAIPFPVYSDAGSVFRTQWGVTGVPLTAVVDRTGTVRWAGYDFAAPPPEEIAKLFEPESDGAAG